MKVNVSIDLEDLFENGYEETLGELINEEVRRNVMLVVKKDPRYKAYINKTADSFLSGIKI